MPEDRERRSGAGRAPARIYSPPRAPRLPAGSFTQQVMRGETEAHGYYHSGMQRSLRIARFDSGYAPGAPSGWYVSTNNGVGPRGVGASPAAALRAWERAFARWERS